MTNSRLAGSLAGEEYGNGRRRTEDLSPDVGVVRARVEAQLRQAIQKKIESDAHLHAGQMHSEADVRTVSE